MEGINSQKLPWTAALKAEHEGRRVRDFGLGHIPLQQPALRKAAATSNQQGVPERRLLAASATTAFTSTAGSQTAHVATSSASQQASPTASQNTSVAHRPSSSAALSSATRAPTSTTRVSSSTSVHSTTKLVTTSRAPTTTKKPTTTTRKPATTSARATTTAPAPHNYTVPVAYDARDISQGQVACKAYTVLDQGSCDSCYAFATAVAFSARLCRFNPTSLGNAIVSPQQIMDCTSGCNGGNQVGAFQAILDDGNVELWCDPYTQTQQTCGSFCATGNTYTGVQGSLLQLGGAGPAGVLQMQYELVRGGPGAVAFTVMNDFFSYASGVYTPSAGTTSVGGHMVALIGWGEDNGVPYWLCQNSWGASFGEAGFFRILRGSDTCGIESSGLTVLRPAAPTACPNAKCADGSVTLADCTCRCDNGKTGPDCSVCALKCLNGGVLDSECTQCTCPFGFTGSQCEAGYAAAPLATCAGDATPITVSYTFGDGAPPPTQATLVGVYQLGEQNPYLYLTSSYVCSPTYNASIHGGLCPATGTITIPNPGAAGSYQIAVAPWVPGYQW